MGFKVIDGVVYEVKEVCMDNFNVEFEEAKMNKHLVEGKLAQFEAAVNEANAKFEAQKAIYQKQIDAIEENRVNAITPYLNEIDKCNAEIVALQEKLDSFEGIAEALEEGHPCEPVIEEVPEMPVMEEVPEPAMEEPAPIEIPNIPENPIF